MVDFKSLEISQENLKLEKESLESIENCLNNNKSFIFDTGAGAGKTYTLIETLKCIIESKGYELARHKQNILCITYTNNAANEIKNRLGNTRLAKVSTIHEAIWDIIKGYKTDLVEIHENKLLSEIEKNTENLQNEKWAEKYKNLSNEKQSNFRQIMQINKNLYYQNYNNKAEVFRENLQPLLEEDFSDILKNVANFKKIINAIYKIQDYQETLENIKQKKKRYTYVTYDARYNSDRLKYMYISHDTLLEYAHELIDKFDVLKQLIIDKYPFILVDEYQDTSAEVVEILESLYQYSREISHTFLISFYGDKKQKIYDSGIGELPENLRKNLNVVKKEFNRRSSPEIIRLSNRIRNDNLEQKSIYSNYPKGDIVVEYSSGKTNRDSLINELVEKWSITEENPLHCLELTNELVATQNGFNNIYDFFKNSPKYKDGMGYQNLNTQTLSTDISKLGNIQKQIIDILHLKKIINEKNTIVSSVIKDNIIQKISLSELQDIIQAFEKISANTFREYLKKLFEMRDENVKRILESLFNANFNDFNSLEMYISEELTNSKESLEKDDDSFENLFECFLDLNLTEFEKWYNFIYDDVKDIVIYHTYHSTKGLEYDNLLIFISNDFGRDKGYFTRLFTYLNNPDNIMGKDEKRKFEEAKNLFYVSVTRAKLNLAIFFLDETDGYKNALDDLFKN